MNSNTPTTSPSSDGATSATIASLSPKDLTDDYEQVDTVAELSPGGTFPSTTSVHPKNAFAVSAIDTATAGGDNFNEQFPVNQQVPARQRNHTMLESMMGLRRAEGNETEGARAEPKCCAMNATHQLSLSLPLSLKYTVGLISAVVIHETGSSDDSARNRLSSMIQPIKRRRDVNSNSSQRCFCSLITWLPTVYVLCWTVLGLTCFVFSLMRPDGSTGPLFYTGQTWIGLVIKATYSFFGVEPDDKNLTSSATAQTQGGQQGQPQSEVRV
eukprot:scaffold4963_cov115-Skeletonema_dohrnii-CCMP3373.AAC.4